MKKAIVITSIFKPTEAVVAFSKLSDYQLIVVGDKKTPPNWSSEGVNFLSIQDQELSDTLLAKVLPYNHYCRKMLGYLKAIELGADEIIDTDDDNFPKENWGFPSFEQTGDCVEQGLGFINVYELFTTQKIWPRGLPLNYINRSSSLEDHISTKPSKVGIWQGLADEDPDVDAIYRLTDDTPCYFKKRDPIVLDQGTLCPFNSQNTLFRKELFPLMYLPTYVSFRFTDILRGLVAQPLLWLYDYRLGFTDASVVQKRNPHNYMEDFISEIPMYRYSEKVIALVQDAVKRSENLLDNLYNAYQALLKEGIVCEKEMTTLEAWLKAMGKTT